jgi:hypothetical protein
MWNWYTWPTVAAFTAWHADACTALSIPHPNENQASHQVDESAQWTTAYTSVTEVAADDWRAIVEGWVAVMVPDGLGVPCDPPPSPDFPEEISEEL